MHGWNGVARYSFTRFSTSRALVKETASFTTTNGAHFRTLIPFSPSLNTFYLTESIPYVAK